MMDLVNSFAQRKIDQIKESESEKINKERMLPSGFLFMNLFLIFCLVLSFCELLIFSWKNKGSSSFWSSIAKQVKLAAKRRERLKG